MSGKDISLQSPADSPAAQLRRERLRRRYRPAQVRLLFIGESPPASGRFFYQRDSGLYRAVRDAFLVIDPSIGNADFLSTFQAAGCYLIDVSLRPVDRLDPPSRRAVCVDGEALLCRTIKKLQPQAIVTVVRSIRCNVKRAVDCASWQGRLIDLPYPGRWVRQRELFVAGLMRELKALAERDHQICDILS